jgi:hypothetical protein
VNAEQGRAGQHGQDGLGPALGEHGRRRAGGAVQLIVTNNSGGPMEVYAAGSGTLYRIGTVSPAPPRSAHGWGEAVPAKSRLDA